MIKDPDTTWDGPFPYDELAAAGITPDSTQREVADEAPFTLMTLGLLTTRAQRAVEELRDPQRRLVADFLLYDIDLAADIERTADRLGPLPGEPEAVTETLSPRPGWLTTMAQAIAATARDTTGIPGRPALDALAVGPLIDTLIEFDR
jgi:hypothetical protein